MAEGSEEMTYTVAATGHRPTRLGGYGASASLRLEVLARYHIARLAPTRVISGMALGWDQAFAQAAVRQGVPFVAAVPFAGQESMWPDESRCQYNKLLALAAEVVIVCPGGYSVRKMQIRNEWMVDRCDTMLALWDGCPGGTANCVTYAARTDRAVVNLWQQYQGA